MKIIILVGALSLLVGGCASQRVAVTENSQVVVEAGPEPTMEQATEAIQKYLKRTLKDPDSLKDFNIIGDGNLVTWYRGVLNGGGSEQAWLYCFEYNAKNSYGGYTGLSRDGYAVRMYGTTVSVITGVNWPMADRGC